MQQIIAVGGGGFTRFGSTYALEKYMLAQIANKNPRVCFLSQASAESASYIVKFYDTFLSLGAIPSHVSLFGSVDGSWKNTILEADLVYVGGGNTKSMISLWKSWGVDTVLREAYNSGVVLAGVSAGMICWFEQGLTDSVWPLGVVEGLGFLTGSACPHFDTEVERQEAYHTKIVQGVMQPGIALEDCVAAHFIDGSLHKIVSCEKNKQAYWVTGQEKSNLPVQCL